MTAPDGAHARHREQQIRRILAEHADQVVPGDGMAEIRARIAAPRPWWRRWWDAARALDRYLTTGFASIALTPQSKNGAPGWTPGTPPTTAAPLGGDTAMHTLQSEHTPRGRQMAAALALAHLLESGPPVDVEWKVDGIGRLHGHVHRPHSDRDARRAVDELANFLRAEVKASQGRNDHAEWTHLSTTGTYRDVPVNVWTHVAIRSLTPFGSKA